MTVFRVARPRSAREVLRGLTVPAALVVVLLAVATGLLQVPRWVLAAAAEVAEVLVMLGQAAQDHVAGEPVAVVTTVPLRAVRVDRDGGVR